jgi:hypothetical protein
VPPLVWIVGDWEHDDFRKAMAWLDSSVSCSRFCAPNAANEAPPPRDPHAILLVQSRPAQFSQHEVERLHAAAPLARLLALTGPWCEGEGRSGRPWLGVTRVSWKSWRTRLSIEMGLRQPRTASESQRIEQSVADAIRVRRFDALAHINTESRLTFETLAEALGQLGVRSAWLSAGEQPAPPQADVVLLDGWDQTPAVPPERSILLLHFPRPQDAARATQLGIAVVLAQPLLLADLAESLALLLPGQSASRDSTA